jgi:hypothetical protein
MNKMAMQTALGVCLVSALAAPAAAQIAPPVAREVNLSGPRFGVTALDSGVRQQLKTDHGIDVGRAVSQFGWQFEKQFYGGQDGPAMITEAIALVGGLDQGVALPSLSWLVGVRTRDGAEIGVGPNITPVGVALALAAGKTFRVGVMNVPFNVAVVPAKSGMRVSFLTGIALRR